MLHKFPHILKQYLFSRLVKWLDLNSIQKMNEKKFWFNQRFFAIFSNDLRLRVKVVFNNFNELFIGKIIPNLEIN